jgi:replicative DNA helicase
MPDPRDKPESYRHVPYDIDVEQALLGSILGDNTAYWRLEGSLTEEDFYDPLHGRIFEMIGDRMKRRMVVTPLTLHASMKSDPGVIETGGQSYFDALRQSAPAIPNIKDYARILHDLSARRTLIRIGEDLVNAAYNPPEAEKESTAEAIANDAAERIFEISRRTDEGRGAVKIVDLMSEAVDKAEHAANNPAEVCLTSGLKLVDQELGGLYRSDLTILAGAPNMGKSALAEAIGVANGLGMMYGETRADLKNPEIPREQVPTLFFSLEMADWQVGAREVAQLVEFPSSLMRRGKTDPFTLGLMRKRIAELPEIKLRVDGGRKLSVQQIRARCHAQQRYTGGKLGMVIVDHLRFVRPANWKLDEKDQIQQITQDLKDLAVELNVAVVLLAHLNREYNKRHSKRPINSDLYGASAIEQNADAIWFLHSEAYFLEREEPPASDAKARSEWQASLEREKGWMEIFSTKARMDKVGKARVLFEPHFTRFSDPDFVQPSAAQKKPDLLNRVSDPLDDLDNRSPPVGG